MATLTQFVSLETNKSPKKFYYICGVVEQAVEFCLDLIRQKLKVLPSEFVVVHGDKNTETEIREALFLASTYQRLVFIRSAEKMKRWNTLYQFLHNPGMTTMVIITNEADPRKGRHPDLFRWIAKNGRFVECRELTEKQALEFIQTYLNIDNVRANKLYNYLGNDTSYMLNELAKIRQANITDFDTMHKIISAHRRLNFVTLLLEKPSVKQHIPDQSLASTLALLELEIVRQAAAIGLTRAHVDFKELATRLNAPQFVVKDIMRRAAMTSPQQIAQRLKLLVTTQDYYRRGYTKGLSLWFTTQWPNL